MSDWCQLNDISQLIIGNNQGWKQDINIGKKNNQVFTNIPHSKLINLLTYKSQLAGIEVVLTEESYTSKASALDSDILPSYHVKTDVKPVFLASSATGFYLLLSELSALSSIARISWHAILMTSKQYLYSMQLHVKLVLQGLLLFL